MSVLPFANMARRTVAVISFSLSRMSHSTFLSSHPREIESKKATQTVPFLINFMETTSRDRKHLDSGSSKTSNPALLSLLHQGLWTKSTRTCLQAFASLSDGVRVEQFIAAECVLSAHDMLLTTQGYLISVQHNEFLSRKGK